MYVKTLIVSVLNFLNKPVMRYDLLTSFFTFGLGVVVFPILFHFQIRIGGFIVGHPLNASIIFMLGHFLMVQVVTYSQRQIIINKFANKFWIMYILSSIVTLVWYFTLTYLNSNAIFYDEIKANNVWLITRLVINAGSIMGKYFFIIITFHAISCYLLRKLLPSIILTKS